MKKSIILICFLSAFYSLSAQWSTNGTNVYYNGGKVGIGTNVPRTHLEVGGVVCTSPNKEAYFQIGAYSTTDNYGYLSVNSANPGTGLKFETAANATANWGITRMIINNQGNVGIGTLNPGSFRLAVEGTIGAREVKVTVQNPWPDYVFNKQYKLRSLASVEQFIHQNKHLPGMPSAAEVKENDGIELGAMNAKLLEKIEELTLYVIELNKKVEKLEKENASLKK